MALSGVGTATTTKRSRSDVVLIIICLVCQTALATQISILGGTVNFCMILAGIFAARGDAGKATAVGFAAGLYFDMMASTPVGLMALLLTIGSFFYATVFGGQQTSSTAGGVGRFAGFAFAVNLVFGLILFIFGIQTSIVYAMILTPLVNTLLTTLVFWPFSLFFGAAPQTSGFSGGGFTAGSSLRAGKAPSPRPRSHARSGSTRYKQKGTKRVR